MIRDQGVAADVALGECDGRLPVLVAQGVRVAADVVVRVQLGQAPQAAEILGTGSKLWTCPVGPTRLAPTAEM